MVKSAVEEDHLVVAEPMSFIPYPDLNRAAQSIAQLEAIEIVVQFHRMDSAAALCEGAVYFQTVVVGDVDLLEVDAGITQGFGMN